MLTTYHLDHPETGDAQVLDGWSYSWGAVGGPIYVFAKGFRLLALVMLAISCGLAVGAFLVLSFAVTVLSDPLMSVGSILITVVVATFLHSAAAVELVRYGLIRRGWREGYYY